MPAVKKSEKQQKKDARWRRVQETAFKYQNVLFVDANNVSSKQICMIRAKLRAIDAVMVMGKNTLMRAAMTAAKAKPVSGDADFAVRKDEWYENPNCDKIITQLRKNTNLIFSNGDLGDVKAVLDEVVRPSPAKAGMIAPADVSIPAGPTGLDPKQTAFFQNLQIQTKIVKAQIDITQGKQVINKGDKIGATEAQLLDKLKIYPFEYKMEVKKVLQDGSLFDAAVLDLSEEVILAKFKKAVTVQASMSLGLGIPTQASAPHTLLNGFKSLVAVCAATEYSFPEAKAMLSAAASAPAATATTAKAAVAEAPKEVEEKEEVDMGGAADLFGGGDDYY
jgi:large subunit ribosomal protein LP0